MYNLLHTSQREKETDNWDLYKALRNLPISMREMSPERKKTPWRSHNYEWNCSISLVMRVGGEEGNSTPFFFRDGGNGWRLSGAGNFRADTAGLLNIPLDQRRHWRAQVTIWWQLWRQETRPPGAPWGLSTLVTQCLCSVQDQEPWNNGQGPKAAASLDKKSSTLIISAAGSCSWPHKDAGNAGQKYTGTCRSQKAIPSSQSLLLTSKY